MLWWGQPLGSSADLAHMWHMFSVNSHFVKNYKAELEGHVYRWDRLIVKIQLHWILTVQKLQPWIWQLSTDTATRITLTKVTCHSADRTQFEQVRNWNNANTNIYHCYLFETPMSYLYGGGVGGCEGGGVMLVLFKGPVFLGMKTLTMLNFATWWKNVCQVNHICC